MNEPIFHVAIDGVSEPVDVILLEGREAVSRLFEFDMTIVVHGAGEATFLERVRGSKVTLVIDGATRPARTIRAVVGRAQALAHDARKGDHWYRLRLRPALWLLKKRINSRVFQDLTAPDIVRTLLGESEIHQTWRVRRTYEPRPYCVQYQESDFAFIRRLLADEGIFFYFDDPDLVVFADSAEAYRPIEGGARLPLRPDAGMIHRESIRTLDPAVTLTPTSAVVRHYDYERPHVDFTGESALADSTDRGLEVYDYRFERGREVDSNAARTSLEQQLLARRSIRAASHCRRLAPGRTFELVEHPNSVFDGEYAVTTVTHRGRQAQPAQQPSVQHATDASEYECETQCVAANVPMRPRRRKRTLHQVVETAVVVGPPGEEIHVDQLGRVKVQFHWDRYGRKNDHSSCWLRIVQPWAGAAWGTQFVPRMGMEVLVSFVGGDVDRPVVIGSLYNATHPVPFPLPENKTQSGIHTATTPGGGGANILRFEDARGREQIYLHAERDLDTEVLRNHTTSVGADQISSIRGNAVTTVERNHVLHVVGRQYIQIDAAYGGDEAPPADRPRRVAARDLQMPGDALHDGMVADAEIRDALLLLHTAQLPADAQTLGMAIEATQRARLNELAVFRDEVTRARQAAVVLEQQATQGDDPLVDLVGLHHLKGEERKLASNLHRFRHRVEDAQKQPRPTRPETEQALAAFDEAMRGLAAEAGYLEEQLANTVGRTSDVLHSAHVPLGGTASGGGGATEGFRDVNEIHFLGPPDSDNKYSRGTDTVKGGSRMDIQGGGEINSPDGFRIAATGGFIELHDGTLTFHGARVEIQAGHISLMGGTIDINGTTVNIVGTPINLN
jgi:type VI secretion system VgrG family protein